MLPLYRMRRNTCQLCPATRHSCMRHVPSASEHGRPFGSLCSTCVKTIENGWASNIRGVVASYLAYAYSNRVECNSSLVQKLKISGMQIDNERSCIEVACWFSTFTICTTTSYITSYSEEILCTSLPPHHTDLLPDLFPNLSTIL